MDGVKFFYLETSDEQLAFDWAKSQKAQRIVGEGHIVHNDQLICGGNKKKLAEEAKKQHTIIKAKTVSNSIGGVNMCQKCIDGYKANKSMAYRRWVDAVKA